MKKLLSRRFFPLPAVTGLTLFLMAPLHGQWIDFVQVTDTNLAADPEVGVNDVEEKAYVVGDFDQDGDPDVVVARKLPFTTYGPRQNVLFLNIGGVLTDVTATLAPQFLEPDNSRDVGAGDFNASESRARRRGRGF